MSAAEDIQSLEVPEGAVIVIRDLGGDVDADGLFGALHEAHPRSLVLLLAGDTGIDTMGQDELETLLREAIAHREAAGL